ncbi:MAG: hypothetical protein WKF47_11720 [Geodermatophilaceae bacterium]
MYAHDGEISPTPWFLAVKQRAMRDGRTVTSVLEEALRDLLTKEQRAH